MRPFFIEFAYESVETHLLLQDIAARRPRRFLLERQVHALVAAVLLRVTGTDALEGDAEPEPPDREL